jgi:hypothetical protein
MGQLNMGYETLLSWIDFSSPSQVTWVVGYLAKKGRTDLCAGIRSEAELLDRLKSALDDEASRELIKRMRGAWSQKKYRESKGRQVSFQLPNDVVKGLNGIAQERRCSKAKALRQVISDAARNRQRENKRSKKKIAELKSNIENLKSTKLQSESIRDRIICELLGSLAKRMAEDCLSEAASVEGGGGDAQERYEALLREKMNELEGLVPQVQMIRPRGRTVRDFFDV